MIAVRNNHRSLIPRIADSLEPLVAVRHISDWGHEWQLRVGRFRGLALFQVSVGWSDWSGCPYLQIHTGQGSLLNVLFWVGKLNLEFGIVERLWVPFGDPSGDDSVDDSPVPPRATL